MTSRHEICAGRMPLPYGTVPVRLTVGMAACVPLRYRTVQIPIGNRTVRYSTVRYHTVILDVRCATHRTVRYCRVPYGTVPNGVHDGRRYRIVSYRTVTATHNAVSVPAPLAAVQNAVVQHRSRRLVYKGSGTALNTNV
jgi:hypothetical protein